MKKNNKFLALALGVVLSLSMLAGCGSKGADAPAGNTSAANTPAASAPAEKGGASGSVYWLNFKPESDQVLQDVAKMYTDKTGVPVKVVTAASGTYAQTLLAEMDKSAPPTLFIVGNQASVKDWKDYALDLKGTPIANELNTEAYNLYDETGKLVPSVTAMSATASS